MAEPMTAADFLARLRAEGVRVVEVGNWRTHNRNSKGAWGPVHGVMIHHTVTTGTANTVKICRDGYSSLPGPLCHGVIAKDGTVHLVGYGRANHAGLGDDDVLKAVIAEKPLPADNEANTDGNARFYGFECENMGDGKDPWPAAQAEAIVRASAAICRAHGWGKDGSTSVLGHAEWQPGKVDPRGPGVSMPDIRARVAERLKHPASWSPGTTIPKPPPEEDMPLTKADVKTIWTTDDVIGVPADWSPGNDSWTAASLLIDSGKRLRALQKESAAQNATIGELAKTVAVLAANTQAIDPDVLVARIQGAIESVTVRLDVPDA